ncbi:MAG TPA: preprotein translocase subunit SecA [Candidatus Azoamicus sp.]
MILKFFKDLFGSRNDRILKKYSLILESINNLELKMSSLSDFDLKLEFLNLKKRSMSVDDTLSYVYSIVREVSKRTLLMRHFDVQMLAGIALFNNKIVEVATGEGKTLIATLPVCLNFIFGKSVHIITVNDYLVSRDANWMKPIYEFLGLTVGCIFSNMDIESKKKAYKCDVVYGTSNEFAFDYLRDNIVFSLQDKVQSKLFFAIIDEVDSVLIDEARTPLIISFPDKVKSNHYYLISKLIEFFSYSDVSNSKNDFILDFKTKNVYLTDSGFQLIEMLFKKHQILDEEQTLYDVNNIELLHIVYSSLRAKFFFKKDVDYIVKDLNVLIIDENTGRIMEGRRWSDGLHQAIEAKEKLKINSENHTLASISFQNFFRLYTNLSGMTGTALTEAAEFENIYDLEVVVIPTNKINIRLDYPDLVFLTKKAKYKAIIQDIKSCFNIGQPVLVGTISIDVSESLSKNLSVLNIKHNVLNAKYHDKESKIIADAGSFKNVTIATNMAGRGTDIVLGGFFKTINNSCRDTVISLGGLKVIGTERHESRRIDNQLRGRCARQGDPGCTQFYVSLEDDLIKVFVGDKTLSFLNKFNLSENDVISHSLVTKSIENAQIKVECSNFDIRKQLLEYDDIINEQRKVFYEYRDSIFLSNDFFLTIKDLLFEIIDSFFNDFLSEKYLDFSFMLDQFNSEFVLELKINQFDVSSIDMFKKSIFDYVSFLYKSKREEVKDFFDINLLERSFFLQILDLKWREHISNLEYLRKGIYLRGYAQKDPKEEYKIESFFLFKSMLYNIKHDFIVSIFRLPFKNFISNYKALSSKDNSISFNLHSDKIDHLGIKNKTKIGRNEYCFCGSRKKYKHCHGKNI